jgi:hypothetical protein
MRLNCHVHTQALDGVYVQRSPDTSPTFHALSGPTKIDLQVVATNVWMRTTRLLQKRGKYYDADPDEVDELAKEYPLLAAAYAASIRNMVASGPRAGQHIWRVGNLFDAEPELATDATSLGRPTHGFDVHAGVRVKASEKNRLERLCRYAARGPIATHRLSRTRDGHIIYELRRTWRDGSSHLVFTPQQFIDRLVALVPPPRFNLTRFHGVFAPASKLRAAIVPRPSGDERPAMKQLRLVNNNGQLNRPKRPAHRKDGELRRDPRARATWAQLLERTFPGERGCCPRCGGALRIVTPALSPVAIRRFLELHPHAQERVPDTLLPRGPPRGQLPLFEHLVGGDGVSMPAA